MYKGIKLNKEQVSRKVTKFCAIPWKHIVNTSGGNNKITGNYFMIKISFGNIIKSCVCIIWFFNGKNEMLKFYKKNKHKT